MWRIPQCCFFVIVGNFRMAEQQATLAFEIFIPSWVVQWMFCYHQFRFLFCIKHKLQNTHGSDILFIDVSDMYELSTRLRIV